MTDISRRRALKVLGAIPVAVALDPLGAQQQPAGAQQQPRTPHATPNQPATAAAAQPAAGAAKPKFFSAKEYRTVKVLADDIIPRDARSGSATDAGVPAYMDYHLSLADTDDAARTAMRGGLRWLDTESKRRFGVAYATAATAQRHAILDDISWPNRATPEMRAGVAFFNRVRDMVASGFYSSPLGWKDVRYVGNTFNPSWNGCPQAALDKLGVSESVMATRVPTQ